MSTRATGSGHTSTSETNDRDLFERIFCDLTPQQVAFLYKILPSKRGLKEVASYIDDLETELSFAESVVRRISRHVLE